MKKRLCVILSAVAIALGCGAAAILLNAQKPMQLQKVNADVYTITMDSSHNMVNPLQDSGIIRTDAGGYEIPVKYDYLDSAEGHYAKFCEYANFYNVDPIHSMQSIEVSFVGDGKLSVSYGFTLPSDLGEQRVLNIDSDTYLTSGVSFDFNDERPAYFQLYVEDDYVIVDSIVIKYSCVASDDRNFSPTDLYEISHDNGNNVVSNPGYFRYWASRSAWGGPQVDTGARYARMNNDYLFFGYSVEGSGQHSGYGVQLYYKNPALTAGETYELSFRASSDVNKTVTINDQSFDLTTPSQEYSLRYTETAGGLSFKLVSPVVADEDNYFQFQNMTWTVCLGAPTNVSLTTANVLTFAAVNHATSYEACIVDSNMDEVVAPFAVTSGDNISSEIPGSLPSGIYYVLVRAKADGYSTSLWSANTASFSIGAVDPIPDADVETPLVNGGEVDVPGNAGTLYYWNDQNWCVSYVAMSKAVHQHRVVTLQYTCTNGACDFGVQLFFKNPVIEQGKTYTLSMTVNSQLALTMKLFDAEVNKRDIPADADTNISVTYTEGAGVSLKLVIPVTNGDVNTVVVSNIAWEEVLP